MYLNDFLAYGPNLL